MKSTKREALNTKAPILFYPQPRCLTYLLSPETLGRKEFVARSLDQGAIGA
jgi:hypothetical protein